MLLWRLSGRQHAAVFDGSYGLLFDGRWNTAGHAVTYCATSPSLCLLEKLVHIEDPALLPDLIMVTYDVPDSLATEIIALADLPSDWRYHEALTQQRGNAWHRARSTPLLQVPSAIMPLAECSDRNVLINHAHPDAATIKLARLGAVLVRPPTDLTVSVQSAALLVGRPPLPACAPSARR